MKSIILTVLLIASFDCVADELTSADVDREIAYGALHAIDWMQTLQIPRHPDIEEGGFVARHVIGSHPTNAQINRYMAGSAILQYAIVIALPHEYRSVFQYVTIVDAGASVVGNFRIGLSVGF